MLSDAGAQFPADLEFLSSRISILFEGSSPLVLYADKATYSNGVFRSFLTLRLFMLLKFKLIV